MPPNADTNWESVADRIQVEVKRVLGDAWDNLSKERLDVIKKAGEDLARLSVRAIIHPEEQDAIQKEVLILRGTLEAETAAEELMALRALRESARRILTQALLVVLGTF
jgi:hypothetical protein